MNYLKDEKNNKLIFFMKLMNFSFDFIQKLTLIKGLMNSFRGWTILGKITKGKFDWRFIENGFADFHGYNLANDLVSRRINSEHNNKKPFDLLEDREIHALEEGSKIIMAIIRDELIRFRFMSESLALYLSCSEREVINNIFPESENPRQQKEILLAKNSWIFMRQLANYALHFEHTLTNTKIVKAEPKILKCIKVFKENNLPTFEYHITENSEDNLYDMFCNDLVKIIKTIERYIKQNYSLFGIPEKEFHDLLAVDHDLKLN